MSIYPQYYIYAYINKNTNFPYYIGKGKNKRAYSKNHCISVPKDITKIIFMESNLTETGALALERRYIRWYGRKDNNTGILLNKTDGGEGHSGTFKKINNPSNRKNTKLSDETKQKISEAKQGHPSNRKNVKLSDETKQKLKKAWEKRKKTPISNKTKQKMRHSQTKRREQERTNGRR